MIYIASPFFNEEQLNKVKSIENILQNIGYDYYSPRLNGNFSELSIPEEDNGIIQSLIFRKNIEKIDECDSIYVNLYRNRDIGTLFELGYAISKNKSIYLSIDEESDIDYFELIDGFKNGTKYFEIWNNESIESLCYIKIKNYFVKGFVNDLVHCRDKFNFKELNTHKYYVVDTNEDSSYPNGIILLGFLFGMNVKVSYVSNYVSKSNLMLTSSGIEQYKNLKDFNNGIKVDYNKMEIN